MVPMSKQTDSKKSSSAGGGAASPKSSAPTASGGAPSPGTNNPPPSESNPETAAAAPGATNDGADMPPDSLDDVGIPPSALDDETRRIAEAMFAGAGPAHIHDYRRFGEQHVVILVIAGDAVRPAVAQAAPAESPLDAHTRLRASSFFEGINPDHIFGYTEYPDRHVIVVMDGQSTTKYTADK
jgi:hypothetical protein